MIKSILKLQETIKAQFVVAMNNEVEQIVEEGRDAFLAAMEALSSADETSILEAKTGGNIFNKPLEVYARIEHAVSEMLAIQDQKQVDYLRYAMITGHDLWRVVQHQADPAIKVVKALIGGKYVEPKLASERARRYALRVKFDAGRAMLARLLNQVEELPAAQQNEVLPLIHASHAELKVMREELAAIDLTISDMFSESKGLEKEYAYTLDENGKKLFPKTSEFNQWYGETLRAGRTAITEFKKYERMKGIDSVIPLSDISSASKLFGLVK